METITLAPNAFTLTYEGKNITEDVRRFCTSITFEDSVEGESSSIEFTLENEDELWSNGWYPKKGDQFSMSIETMDCGTFYVDEIELSGPPDTVTIKAIDHKVNKSDPTTSAPTVRTKKSKAHEKKSLRQIAQHVASANNLTLEGSVPDIMFERVSQKRETDLKFLRRVSFDYGIIFTVRDKKLVFTSMYDVEKRAASLSVDKSQMTSYSVHDKSLATYQKAVVTHSGSSSKTVITGGNTVINTTNKDGVSFPRIVSSDTKVIHKRVENKQQAEAVATAHLYRANSLEQTGRFEFPGTALAIAGNNMEVTSLGTVGSGIWNIQKCSHTLSGGQDWSVSVDVKRLAATGKSKQKASVSHKTRHPASKSSTSGASLKVSNIANRDGFTVPQIN